MDKKLIIRAAKKTDGAELLEIYRPYVENTAISFEYEVPSAEEFQDRIEKISQRYPYIVAVSGTELMGYAYASEFKSRKAYDWAVETSIYLKPKNTGKGYGRILYGALEEILKRQHILNLNACITYVEREDEYATNNSMKFHERMGYRLVGKFSQCGYKFDRWYDMIWMEKAIGPHTICPKPVIPFRELAGL